MTISILAYDEETGSYGGAATTGSLCVGGWVLRGDPESGLSASQGSLPSTLWGTEVLERMKAGDAAATAVKAVVEKDAGRHQRQLAALDPAGTTGAFTGEASIPVADSREGHHLVVAGNLLTTRDVIDACFEAFTQSSGAFALRLLDALDAAEKAGGDSRGLLSAALLIVNRAQAPMTLRIDHSQQPLADLRALHAAATSGFYADWSALVPTLDDPQKADPCPRKS